MGTKLKNDNIKIPNYKIKTLDKKSNVFCILLGEWIEVLIF